MKQIGVLVGVWPCGVIVFANELFHAESKTQVYGILHALIYSNSNTMNDLSLSKQI